MSSGVSARVFYCADCGNRSRCQPLHIVVLGINLGAGRQLIIDLELCPPCKLAWIDHHLNRWSKGRRPMHETRMPDARLRPRDAEDLVELAQWRRGRLRDATTRTPRNGA